MDFPSLLIGALVGAAIVGVYAASLRGRVAASTSELANTAGRLEQLERHNADLTRAAQEQHTLDALLKPVREGLESVTRAAEDADRRRVAAETRIQTEIENIKASNDQLGAATRQLVAAMAKGQSRGQWGEMQLEQLLSHAGMVEGVHFRRQDTRQSDGAALRPDLVVLMPGEGQVLVDAKFPWDAFFEAMGTEDPLLRAPLLEKHSRDLAARINELARKDYTASATVTPDFVVLFLPLEPLLSTALDQDGALLEKAFGKRVVLATPTTMLGLLRTIAFAWNRHDIAVNAEEIRTLSSEMLTRLGTVVDHMNRMGKNLRGSVDAYNAMVASFDTRLVKQAERISALGVPASKALDVQPELANDVAHVRSVGETPELA